MIEQELFYTPATELVALIRSKAISPVQVMQAVLDRADTLNPRLNFICTSTAQAAMDGARQAERAVMRGEQLGPLHGVPCTIKDVVFTKGVRTMAGSHIYADRIPEVDAPVVTRLRDAGAISIGKTTVSEFGWKACSDSPLTGVSHNPWKHGMNAGASSTGAAICAAAGIGPIHQGSDGAGSIRLPAGFCGVYGIKPSFGRVPNYPQANNDCLSHIGPITRTVADAALMLNVMAGPDDRDMTSLEAQPADYLSCLDEGIAGLRVAFSPDLGYLRVDEDVATAVRHAVGTFEQLGCHVDEVNPGWGDQQDLEHFIYSTLLAGNFAEYLDPWESKMDPGLVAAIKDGQTQTAAEYFQMHARRIEYYHKVLVFFDRYDLLLTPTISVAAFPVNRLIPAHWEQHPWDWIRWAGFSYPFNLTWMPAATCPCGFTPGGLPVGLQIAAGRHQDLRVLQASRAFEQARPWADKRPPQ